jgi:surface antigen
MLRNFVILASVSGLIWSAPAQAGDKDAWGTVIGAVGGAVAGAQIGKGKGRLVATAAGTLVGAAIGQSVGRSLDRADSVYYNGVTYRDPPRHHWDRWDRDRRFGDREHGHRDHGYWPQRRAEVTHYYTPAPVVYVQPAPTVIYVPQVRVAEAYCREYTAPIAVGGNTVQGYGTACQRPDGAWDLGPLTPVR